ncbi:arginine deiminase-related protein [Vibrio zhugei]|uniref:Arginine deiminase-related protein n=1 Tax=Vibrio zhugei TaxID=2479546 RepID=A0ABV7C853_9VIBR|nr:arginine deiminase-related protein [Vibrio zhugei]
MQNKLAQPFYPRHGQYADAVVVVPPKEFQFNEQTAGDNEFQTPLSLTTETVQQRAMVEYERLVNGVREAGVTVIEFDYPLSETPTPDAVFPNNWFSTMADGRLITFPMASENRQVEVRPEALSTVLKQAGWAVQGVDTFSQYIAVEKYLESTGAMVMDHHAGVIYAALSQRCDETVLDEYAAHIGYETVPFRTSLPSGQSVYHTNVMMALGEAFCIICDEVIEPTQRRAVIERLMANKDVIHITIEQMNRFCGNVLVVITESGKPVIVLSQSAYEAFHPDQLQRLRQYGELLPIDVTTIEKIGGGSVRCMMAEVFLPRI